MSYFFTDTSALVKRYITEIGSTWVRSWIPASTGNIIIMSDLALVEVYSVLIRHLLANKLTSVQVTALYNTFISHAQTEYFSIPVDMTIYGQATVLMTNNNQLRTLDALQLACAVRANQILQTPITFIAADTKLLTAATHEGFAVDDVNQHP